MDVIENGEIQIVLMCRLGGKGGRVEAIVMEGGYGRGAAVPMRPMRGRVQRLEARVAVLVENDYQA